MIVRYQDDLQKFDQESVRVNLDIYAESDPAIATSEDEFSPNRRSCYSDAAKRWIKVRPSPIYCYVSYVDKLITMCLMIAEPPLSICLYIYLFIMSLEISLFFIFFFFSTHRETAILEEQCSATLAFLEILVAEGTVYLSMSCCYTAITYVFYIIMYVGFLLFIYCCFNIFG